MKNSQQILSLPVLSIKEGKRIGEVKHLVLNPQKGSVDYLLVKDNAWYLGLKAVPFGLVKGIGEFALTIEDRSSLTTVAESKHAIELLEGNFELIGIRILTDQGRLVGSVCEFYIESDGTIAGCTLIPSNNEKPAGIIPKQLILTYGSDFLIVKEDVENHLLTELSKDIPAVTSSTEKRAAATAPAAPEASTGDRQTQGTAKHFEEQQKQYLLGKKVAMRIVADDGKVVAEEGETISAETIERARAADRYIQLTLNVRD